MTAPQPCHLQAVQTPADSAFRRGQNAGWREGYVIGWRWGVACGACVALCLSGLVYAFGLGLQLW